MRWLNRRRHPVRPEIHARHSDRHPSRLSVLLFIFLKIARQFRPSNSGKGRFAVAASPVFLECFVNYFTFNARREFIRRAFIPLFATTPSPHIPNRTVRRVHVSPWASTVRLISRIRSEQGGGDDDGSAGGRLRR